MKGSGLIFCTTRPFLFSCLHFSATSSSITSSPDTGTPPARLLPPYQQPQHPC
jgi:hypothetical protein